MPLVRNLHSNIFLVYEIALDKIEREMDVALDFSFWCGMDFFFF